MVLFNAISYAQQLLKDHITKGDTVVDATCGNGNDTLFLADLVGTEGKVYGFDIQKQAVEQTRKKLMQSNLFIQAECIQDGHENIAQWVKEPVNAAMFNLGYLPGSDKGMTTKPETTIKAIQSLLSLLTLNGLITVVVYTGHDQGYESFQLDKYLEKLPQKQYSVMKYQFINQVHYPPYLIAIEKKGIDV